MNSLVGKDDLVVICEWTEEGKLEWDLIGTRKKEEEVQAKEIGRSAIKRWKEDSPDTFKSMQPKYRIMSAKEYARKLEEDLLAW